MGSGPNSEGRLWAPFLIDKPSETELASEYTNPILDALSTSEATFAWTGMVMAAPNRGATLDRGGLLGVKGSTAEVDLRTPRATDLMGTSIFAGVFGSRENSTDSSSSLSTISVSASELG